MSAYIYSIFRQGAKCTNQKQGGGPERDDYGKIFDEGYSLLYLGVSNDDKCKRYGL